MISVWSLVLLILCVTVGGTTKNLKKIYDDCCSEFSTKCLDAVLPKSLPYGPQLRVGVTTYITDNIVEYAKYSIFVNIVYASRNGYMFKTLSPNNTWSSSERDLRWNKIHTLVHALDPVSGWARDMDYIVWVDADLIFVDHDIRLEQIAAEFPTAHILVCSEMHGLNRINSGSIIVKNSAWAKKFLVDWWNFGSRNKHTDQTQFDLFFQSRHAEFAQRVKFLPSSALNSDVPISVRHLSTHPVLHLMGTSTSFRIKMFQKAAAVVCDSLFNLRRLPPQLTLTKEFIAKITLADNIKAINDTSTRVSHFIFSRSKLLDDSTILNRHVTLTAFASYISQFRNQPGDDILAYDIMYDVFSLWVEYFRSESSSGETCQLGPHNTSAVDAPDEAFVVMIKLPLLELGTYLLAYSHTVSSFATFPIEYKTKAAKVMTNMVNLADEFSPLIGSVALESSRASEMALLYRTLGRTLLLTHNASVALPLLQRSLRIYDKLSEIFGDHVRFNSMLYADLAKAHSSLLHFDTASKYLKILIEWIETYVGDTHITLADLCSMYASLLSLQEKALKGTRSGDAFKKYSRRSLDIYRLYNFPPHHKDYIVAKDLIK